MKKFSLGLVRLARVPVCVRALLVPVVLAVIPTTQAQVDPSYQAHEQQAQVPPPGLGYPSPADPELAIGPNWIVSVTNPEIKFLNKSIPPTSSVSFPTRGSNGFWGGLGGYNVADPSAHYDEATGRFWIIGIEDVGDEGYLYIAVSDDTDPNGTWYKYKVTTTTTTTFGIVSLLDYPTLSMDASSVYVVGQYYASNYSGFVSIDKSYMMNNGSNPPPYSIIAS